MASRIELFEDHIAILPLETDGVSKGGIVLPESARQKSQRGRVLFVGPGRLRQDPLSLSTVAALNALPRWPMPVAVGDIAIYMKYAGHEIEAGEHTITIMKASELLGRIQEVPAELEAPQEEKTPAGLERPPCPLCGLEVIDRIGETYSCEDCGFVTVDDSGFVHRRMAQCHTCKRVDFLRARPGKLSRVRGCECDNPEFYLLSFEEAGLYARGREAVAS